MIDWNRKPHKTDRDILIDKKMKEYKEKFNVDYYIHITSNVDIVADIDKCIKNNKPQEVFKNKDGVIY